MKRLIYILFVLLICSNFAEAQLFEEEKFLADSIPTDSLPIITLDSSVIMDEGTLFWADFDNNLFPDLFFTGKDTSNHYTSIFFKRVGDNFERIESNIIGTTQSTIQSVDFNNDGLQDLLLMGSDSLENPTSKIYLNKGNFVFEDDSLFAIEQLHKGSLVSVDLNNDGKKEVILCGKNKDDENKIFVYQNHLDSLTLQKTSLDSLSAGQIVALNYNQDDHIDLFLTGINSNNEKKGYVYSNEGGFVFKEAFELEGLAKGDASTGDFNTDGLTDILISGEDNNDTLKSILYLNEKNSFEAYVDTLPGFINGKVFIVDFNHNGMPELFLSGENQQGEHQILIYTDSVSGINITDSLQINYDSIQSIKNQLVSIADLNRDGNLDVFLFGADSTGQIFKYFKNTTSSKNYGPSLPSSPIVLPLMNKAYFFWAPSGDDATPQKALSYELFVSTEPMGNNIKSLEGDYQTGYRRVATHGSQGQNASCLLGGLKLGKYYWGVQAIDNSFKGDAIGDSNGGGGVSSGGGEGFQLCFEMAFKDTVICKDKTIEFTSTNDLPIYLFSNNSGFLGTHHNYLYRASESDTVYVISMNPTDCSKSYGYAINVPRKIDGLVDLTVCKGEVLSVNLNKKYTPIQWKYDGKILKGQTFTAPIFNSTTIFVEVVTQTGCILEDHFDVEVYKPVVSLTKNYKVNFGDSVQFDVTGLQSSSWVSAKDTIQKNSLSRAVAPIKTTTYTVVGVDMNGCPFKDSVTVTVNGDLYIPNLFTPNGDGTNDEFKIYGANIETVKLKVFDRNGALVYEGKDSDAILQGWDGNLNGAPQPPGVYMWSIQGTFLSGIPLEYDGKKSGIIRLAR